MILRNRSHLLGLFHICMEIMRPYYCLVFFEDLISCLGPFLFDLALFAVVVASALFNRESDDYNKNIIDCSSANVFISFAD